MARANIVYLQRFLGGTKGGTISGMVKITEQSDYTNVDYVCIGKAGGLQFEIDFKNKDVNDSSKNYVGWKVITPKESATLGDKPEHRWYFRIDIPHALAKIASKEVREGQCEKNTSDAVYSVKFFMEK